MKKQGQDNSIVDMKWILNFCVKLALESCKIVKECFQNSSVKTFMKGVDDPVTEADYKIQTMLVKGIRKHYPNIKIVGEEDVQFKGIIETDYENMPNVNLPESVKFKKDYKCDELCIWIDPIDNTKGFVQGKSQGVTVLIGISYQNKAEIGIIGVPYQKIQNQSCFRPSVVIGCASSGFAEQFCGQSKKWTQIPKHKQIQNKQPIVAVSPSRKNIIEGEVTKELNGKFLYANGAGYKALLVAKRIADFHLYCFSFTKKWDTCAGEAIIRALDGYFLDVFGNQIPYDHTAKSFVNDKGVICGFNTSYRDTCINICKKHEQSGNL